MRGSIQLINLYLYWSGKTEKTQITNTRSDITTDNTDIERIREYYEQFYPTKFNSIVDMDKFLERCKLPKLTHEEIDNLKNPTSTKKKISKYLLINKLQAQMAVLGNSTKHSRKK